MKIDNNTTIEEVKEKTKSTVVGLCSVNRSEQKNISEGIGELFEDNRQAKSEVNLDDYIKIRLLEVQNLICEKRNNSMTIEELLRFINSAMNYGQFQIWLLKNNIQGKELTSNEILKKFLFETSDDDILKLYDVEKNYDEKNIESIRKTFENHSQVNDDSSSVMPSITQESRKILAKSLINR